MKTLNTMIKLFSGWSFDKRLLTVSPFIQAEKGALCLMQC